MSRDETELQLSSEQMAEYKRTARRRLAAEKRERGARHARAWELAHQAALLLKQDYRVERVVAFGSVLHVERFTECSDVDIAAWGLTSANWLKAIVAVQGLSPDIEINLVDVGACSAALLTVIERDGVEL